MTEVSLLTEPDQARALCAALREAGAACLPLFLAAAEGRIDLLLLADRTKPWPGSQAKRLTRPTIVLVGDDPRVGTGVAYGPRDWLLARRLQLWARCALIHGAAGLPDHYRLAVEMAEGCGRLAMVETSSGMAASWAQFLGYPGMLILTPLGGERHPVAVH